MPSAQWQALQLTLLVATTAVAFSLPAAIAVGWILARWRFPGKIVLDTAVNLPLVLPPIITGYLLLLTFGRHGVIGRWLEATLGMRFVFDWKGAVLAAAVMSFPLLVRPIRQAFAAIDERLLHAARGLGATPFDAFATIALPLARAGIVSGSILAIARCMGEFGATIMLAGNIPGETRTVPLFVYNELDRPAGLGQCYGLVIVSVIISAVALAASEWLDRWHRRSRSDDRVPVHATNRS